MILLLSAAAFAGSLGLTASRDVNVFLDGRAVNASRTAVPAWVEVDGGAPHVIEARSLDGRTVFGSLPLVVPDGIELAVGVKPQGFEILAVRSLAPPPPMAGPVGASLSVTAGPDGASVKGPGISVQAGVTGVGVATGPANVNAPGMTVTTSPPPPMPPPPPAATGPVDVSFLRTDTEWGDLYVDGKKVAEYRVGNDERMVKLTPGAHKVEWRAFMGDEVFAVGHLMVAGPGMKVGLSEGGVEVYNIPSAWGP